jgi:integrase
MPRITSHPRVVAAAKSINRQRTKYSIIGIPGLILECAPNGSRTWYARYQIGHGRSGRKLRYHRLGSFDQGMSDYLTFGQARDRSAALHTDAKRDGKDPFAEARGLGKGSTFDSLFALWLERHAKMQKRSWPQDESRYRLHIKERLGPFVASEIKRRDIIEALNEISEQVSGVTANRCQAVISAVLRWALDEDLIEHSPAHGIRKRGQETQRERVMTEQEMRAFWSNLTNSQLDRAIKLLLLLGQRRTETAAAKLVELQADAWHIPGETTKNALPHIVPLTELARSLFGSGFDFHPTKPSHRVRDIVQALGFEDFRLHDLRHCAATGMAALGVPRDVRERVQNQITGRRQSIGARYDQHEYLDEKRRALLLWERRLLEIVENRKPSGERW